MERSIERRLAAILSADVKGYSRLMSDDEVATVDTLTAYRRVVTESIERFRGRVVDSPGDNILAEFPSVVDAVQTAVKIQEELAARNAGVPETRRMEFRIGINLGDVIVQEGRIYGDGVNIAARIEALTDPGGISVAAAVYEQVKNKTDLVFEDAGQHALKNIADPVRMYRVRTSRDVPVTGRSAPPSPTLPDKPSIVVLPFINLSGNPEEDYFSDGITQDIITDLAKVSGIFVIARHSAFVFKGSRSRVQDVSRDLGVRYVLEGSIRRSADRVRVTVQLVDGITGHHLWADRYDRELRDIFELQDEITRRIVTELQVQLTEGEQARVWRRATADLEAYDAFLRGRERFLLMHRDDNRLARELLQKAVDRDLRFAHAVVLVGATHLADAWFGWSPSPAESLARAAELAARVLDLDEFNADAYALLGMLNVRQGRHGEAIAQAEKAVSLSPSGADVAAYHADVLNLSGRPEDGLVMIRRAMRLSPTHPPYYVAVLGQAYWLTGRYEEAIATHRRYAALEPANPRPLIGLAALFVLTGQMADARAATREVLRLHPKFSVERWARQTAYRNPEDLDRAVTALKQAGLE